MHEAVSLSGVFAGLNTSSFTTAFKQDMKKPCLPQKFSQERTCATQPVLRAKSLHQCHSVK